AESVAYALTRDGFEATIAKTLREGAEQLSTADLSVLDLMLPDGSGFDFIRDARRRSLQTPIIVLSSRDGEADRVAALETGADDYVNKPFSPREIVARVRAVLRRVAPTSGPASGAPEALGRVAIRLPLSTDEATRRACVH